MQAIITKYLGPTNTRGSRIKATACNGQSVTIDWDYSLPNSTDANHAAAARALADKLNWPGQLVGGHLASGMCWVWDCESSTRTPSTADGKPRE